MALQYQVSKEFTGYYGGYPAKLVPDGAMIQMSNMWGSPSTGGGITYYNMFGTLPASSNYKTTMPAVGRSRGMFQHYSSFSWVSGSVNAYLLAFQCTTDYTTGNLYALDIDANTWSTLTLSGATLAPYHAHFEAYQNKSYIATPDGRPPLKWHKDFGTALGLIRDKGNPITLAARTLTWNATALVTADADVSATIVPGMFIRRSATSPYWDEVKSVTNAGLNINLLVASTDTGASAAGGSQYTGSPLIYAKFIKLWKEKMWLANSNYGTVGNQSTLYWSVTADPDNWTSVNAGCGFIQIEPWNGDQIVGLATLDDYLFVFKDTNYYVYKWTGDLDVPIALVKKVNYGCVSQKSIIDIGGVLVYFSGSDLRMTDGSNDVPVSDGFEYFLRTYSYFSSRSAGYFSLTSTDNNYPYALFDEVNNYYYLFLSGNTYIFNVDKKLFIGQITADADGGKVKVYGATTPPVIVGAKGSLGTSNQLVQYSRTTTAKDSGNTYQYSKLYDFGLINKDKKVYWVEFEFHPNLNCNTVITFQYWDGGEKYTNLASLFPGKQTYNLTTGASTDDTIVRQRFNVNDTLKQFGWVLSDTSSSGTDGWGVVSVTICWEPVDNS